MIFLRRPHTEIIRSFLAEQARESLSYTQLHATKSMPRTETPQGYVLDLHRQCIGASEQEFTRSKDALMRCLHLQLGWVEPWMIENRVRDHAVIGILARWAGIWFLHACRVVYLLDDYQPPVHRCGFAYGTLQDHAESGEERFLLEYNADTHQVDYEILAFSKPSIWYTKLGYPLVRRQQQRFARDSISAMQRAIQGSTV